MQTSKWLLTTTLAAAIAFSSLSLIASADDGEAPADLERPMQQHMEEIKAAVEGGDYNAFAEVAPEKLLEVINADNFGRFVEMHQYREKVRNIAEELGLPQGKGKMNGKMHKFQNCEQVRNMKK